MRTTRLHEISTERLIFLLCALSLISQSSIFAEISNQPLTLDEVSAGLICQCGCGMTLLNCNHLECPSGIPMEKTIGERIEAGLTKEEIVQEFVTEYGDVILAAPPKSGFHLTVWIAPFIALLLGLLLIASLLRKWSRRRKDLPPTPEASPKLDPAYLARIEKELKETEK